MSRRKRGLRPEEEELWNRVARSTTPLFPERKKPLMLKPEEQPKLIPPEPMPPAPKLTGFRIGEKARPLPSPAQPEGPIRMDAKTHGKMRRGKLVPEARIDLHGLTLAEAHPELMRFIFASHDAGLRLVLVITGKGKGGMDDRPIPRQRGILRLQVPQWLCMAPLGPLVLDVTEAHFRHGGGGAYYVYLKRLRG